MLTISAGALDTAVEEAENSVRERSVRTLLFWLVLACLVPGIMGAVGFFVYEYRSGRTQLEKDTIQTARALAQAVDNRVLQLEALAQGLATSRFLQAGDLAQFHMQARRALEQTKFPGSVVLTDRSGQQFVNTARPFGQALPVHGNPEAIRLVLDTRRPLVSNVFFSTLLQRQLVAVVVPVFIENRAVLALTITLPPESLKDILESQGLPDGWVATILDRTASIVARSRETERYVGQKPAAAFHQRFLSSEEGIVEGVMKDGVAVLAAYTRSAASNWTVALSIPQSYLGGQFARRLSAMALGIACLFAIGLALARWVSLRIAASFQSLIGPANALGAGRRVDIPLLGVKEANEVGKAIGLAAGLLTRRNRSLQESNAHLLEKERELEEAHHLARFGTWNWDLESGEFKTSDSLHDIFGRDVPAFSEQRGTLLTLDSWDRAKAAVDEASKTDGFDLELQAIHSTGATVWVHCKGKPVRNGKGIVVALRGTMQDITQRKVAEQCFREAALHDTLTGLPNRALIFENGGRLLAGAVRGDIRGALLFVDLDRFKPINDLHGHEVGDRVLQEVASRLKSCTRREDLVGRLGGDEFVVILARIGEDCHRAAVVAQHIVDRISRPYLIDSLELSLSPSIGISCFPDHAADVNTLIRTADLAMYRVKQSGRAAYQFYSKEFEQQAGTPTCTLTSRLERALDNHGLKLLYQPIVDIRSGLLIGAEALLRLADDPEQQVAPDSLIPVAESAGLMEGLGEWIAREACRQHQKWLKDGLRVTIAINVSPQQFRQRHFAERVGCIVSQSGVDPACVQLEIAESTVLENFDDAIKVLGRIKSLGMKVALDDFGTGYSSLSTLTSLPLDKLKVDRSFVRRLESDAPSRAVTDAIIALGHTLHLEVVGEGIESESALRYLEKHGCNQGQGFLFSPPLAGQDLTTWHAGNGHAKHAAEPA